MNREEEYNKERDAFVKEMLEKNPVAEDLKEAAIGYWERIFSEGCSSTTEEERKLGEKRRKEIYELARQKRKEQGLDY